MDVQILDCLNPLWLQIIQKLNCDFYHLLEYVSIEANRIKAIPEAFLAVDGEKIFFVPYLLRKCDETILPGSLAEEVFDVTSPYGYPGILLTQSARSDTNFLNLALQELKSLFANRGICSAFFRLHPILNPDVLDIFPAETFKESGETISIDLKLTEAQMWSETRGSHRTKINRCKSRGMTAKIVDYQQYLPEFIEIYQETMDRVAANQSYYFDERYYLDLLQMKDKVHLCIVELEKQAICASLLFEHNGIVQYHLGGTKNDFLKLTPTTLMFDFIRLWAKERGNLHFHLGGGLGGAKDSLHHFKAGFSKQRYQFFTLSLITHPDNYQKLVDRRSKALNLATEKLLQSGFFPAYRFNEKLSVKNEPLHSIAKR
jgi:hypothetical protein